MAVAPRLPEALAARVQPDRAAARAARDAEGDVESAVLRGGSQLLAHLLAMVGGHAVEQFLAADDATAAPAEHRAGDVGEEHHVLVEIPFPDAAARRLDGEAEALLVGGPLALRGLGAPALDDQQQGQGDADDQGDQQREQGLDLLALGGGGRARRRGGDGQQGAVGGRLRRHVEAGAVWSLRPLRRLSGEVGGRDREGVLQACRGPHAAGPARGQHTTVRQGHGRRRRRSRLGEQRGRVGGGQKGEAARAGRDDTGGVEQAGARGRPGPDGAAGGLGGLGGGRPIGVGGRAGLGQQAGGADHGDRARLILDGGEGGFGRVDGG